MIVRLKKRVRNISRERLLIGIKIDSGLDFMVTMVLAFVEVTAEIVIPRKA